MKTANKVDKIEAGDGPVEITQEMVDAGAFRLFELAPDQEWLDYSHGAKEIYLAMQQARPKAEAGV